MEADEKVQQAEASAKHASAAAQAKASQLADAVDASPSPKRKAKRGWIVAGVVAAVIVVAGVGFYVWHNQPSFCNAICHTPMDSYVEGYYSGDASLGVTKHASEGKTCLSCHEAVFTDQVSEAMAWASDNFAVTEDGLLAEDMNFASEEFCARSGCHNMTDVVNDTWGFEGNDEKFNPHSSHQDNALECGDCHKMHSASVLVCAECHSLTAPEGWEVPHDQAA